MNGDVVKHTAACVASLPCRVHLENMKVLMALCTIALCWNWCQSDIVRWLSFSCLADDYDETSEIDVVTMVLHNPIITINSSSREPGRVHAMSWLKVEEVEVSGDVSFLWQVCILRHLHSLLIANGRSSQTGYFLRHTSSSTKPTMEGKESVHFLAARLFLPLSTSVLYL